MKKQTAVEWLKKELEDYGSNSHLSLDWNTFDELCEQAKAMHKEQMEEMFCEGSKLLECPNELSAKFEFALYYIETYGGGK